VKPPATLLVVDDVAENRDILERRLSKRGFSVATADSGAQALRILDGQDVDLVLLDIMMPGMSGIEVLEKLRSTRSADELPVIMVTARADSADVVDALERGANDYVTKPVDFPVLLARVQTQLRLRRPGARGVGPAPAPAVTPRDIGPGVVLAERYRLDARLGSGGFGTVYRATHLELHSPVAVKVLDAGLAPRPEAVARFRQEGISACRVRHPNAVSVIDFGITAGGAAYLVMELLEGQALQEELLRRGRLSPRRAAQVLLPVCDVLAVAHDAGVVHRDIKPSNVFLQRTVVGEIVKVLDFGIAKLLRDAVEKDLTLRGRVVGTAGYVAPERFQGRPYDGKADVYAMGIMLFQMLEGELPFVSPGDPMGVALMHVHNAPPPLRATPAGSRARMQALLDRVLAKDPRRRPTARALAAELAGVRDLVEGSVTLTPVAAAGFA